MSTQVAARTSPENPLGTDGFEFVEFAAPDPSALGTLFQAMGFTALAEHRSKAVTLYRQNDINFIVDAEPDSRAFEFADAHGPSACAMAFRVGNSGHAVRDAIAAGAKEIRGSVGPMELNIPAIEGIGGSLIYLVDRYESRTIYDVDFKMDPASDSNPPGVGLLEIDHLTHNVGKGRMDYFHEFYRRIFNFSEQQYFDIKGEYTGLTSRALAAPCRKIRIPINESKFEDGGEQVDQIQEFIRQYRGEGIQHIALRTNDIFKTFDELQSRGIPFMSPPADSYYEMLDERLPGHGQPVEELRKRGILLDGSNGKYLRQIFTQTLVGPIFFEIIERLGDEGFGNGNFRALFLSMERDQIRRGTLKAPRSQESA